MCGQPTAVYCVSVKRTIPSADSPVAIFLEWAEEKLRIENWELRGKWGLTHTYPLGERAEVGGSTEGRVFHQVTLLMQCSVNKKRTCRRAEVSREHLLLETIHNRLCERCPVPCFHRCKGV